MRVASLTLIKVGPPVARRPPHRSRRAVLPHRALQSCSHPHERRRSQETKLSLAVLLGDPRSLHSKIIQETLEACPGIALALTTTIEPLEQ